MGIVLRRGEKRLVEMGGRTPSTHLLNVRSVVN